MALIHKNVKCFPKSNPISTEYSSLRQNIKPLKRKQRIKVLITSRYDIEELVKGVSQGLWGKGLPPGALVSAVKEGWTTAWKVMMVQMAPRNNSGSYERPRSAFRNKIEKGGTFPPEKGRYHLYAALSCPWAHRALIVHSLKGLSDVVPLSIASPSDSGLWQFKNDSSINRESSLLKPSEDRANNCLFLKEVYNLQDGGYNGRSTVPMLWDTKLRKVVNNESADIIEILNSAFDDFVGKPENLYPEDLKSEIEAWNAEIYEAVNNGVYKCGFATTQKAYEEAVDALFSTLDKADKHLGENRYLCGNKITLADIRLFTTLFRFDAVYSVIFKCTRKKISEYQNLSGYLRELYQIPEIKATCDIQAVAKSYFGSLFPLNPGGIIPALPIANTEEGFGISHGRENIGSSVDQ